MPNPDEGIAQPSFYCGIPRCSPCFAMMLQILAVKSALCTGLPPRRLVGHGRPKTCLTFRSTLQQTLLRKRSTMEAALREVVAKKGISMLQLTCMHDLGITTSRNLSVQDQELLLGTSEWKTLLQAEIQSSKNQLDSMAKKQTRRCEHQAKRQEAQEYLRDKKGPSKFCGNTHEKNSVP